MSIILRPLLGAKDRPRRSQRARSLGAAIDSGAERADDAAHSSRTHRKGADMGDKGPGSKSGAKKPKTNTKKAKKADAK
jgi:hypothetical protein